MGPVFGFSVFASDGPLDEAYLATMAQAGFRGVFTSLHIPEDDAARYRDYLKQLGAATRRLGLELTVDISGEALARAGFSWDNLAELRELGVTRLRADFHISNAQIAEASRQIGICLNASTVTTHDVAELNAANADFTQLIAWHNYYPRPQTGLARKDFVRKNQFLKQNGFTIVAFTPGDAKLRAPLHSGLPTLERHRYLHPLAGALDLLATGTVDEVYIGDGGIEPRTLRQFRRFFSEGIVELGAEKFTEQFDYAVAHPHVNRWDAARDVIRSAEARFWEVPVIPPLNSIRRKTGAITIDNQLYGRYQGDIQIAKRPLPADPKVNVVGRVIKKDRDLLSYVAGGQRFVICDVAN